jgi:hypothetical protein
MFCSGHVTLPDGRVLIQGGTKSYPTVAGGADYGGLKNSWIFDPVSNTFTTVAAANEAVNSRRVRSRLPRSGGDPASPVDLLLEGVEPASLAEE